jgi:hypothetical protein
MTFSEKLRLFLIIEGFFQKLRGVFNTFLVKLRLFESDKVFQKSEAFLKHLKRNVGFFQYCEAF